MSKQQKTIRTFNVQQSNLNLQRAIESALKAESWMLNVGSSVLSLFRASLRLCVGVVAVVLFVGGCTPKDPKVLVTPFVMKSAATQPAGRAQAPKGVLPGTGAYEKEMAKQGG